MEDAIRKRIEIAKEVKKRKANVALINSKIAKSEELLENYHNFFDFLKRICPPNAEPVEFFKQPKQVLDELAKVENNNLFLIQKCHEMEEQEETGLH
jgi:hypothetical protein